MIREIRHSDKEDVLRISSQIWEGDDYVINVFDRWVTSNAGIFAGYWDAGKLIGFGRMRFLTPTDIWLEALRKDPQTKIKGIGYKISKYYMDKLKGKEINSIRFSTYFDNTASITLNEKLGFIKILTLSMKEFEISSNQVKTIDNSIITDIDLSELDKYIKNSNYLFKTKGFISKGWIIRQYSKELINDYFTKNRYVVYKIHNEIKGAMLISDVEYQDIYWLSFIEAENKKIFNELIKYAENEAITNNFRSIQLLVPDIKKLKQYVDCYGFKSWEQNDDFLVYELPRTEINQITGRK
jgi:hypothetical protein